MNLLTITLEYDLVDLERRVERACTYLKEHGATPTVLTVHSHCGDKTKLILVNRSEVTCEKVLDHTLDICKKHLAIFVSKFKIVGYYTPESGVVNAIGSYSTIVKVHKVNFDNLRQTHYEYFDERTSKTKFYKVIL